MVLLPASSIEPKPQRDLTFIKNQGQWNQTAKFLYRSVHGNLWVTSRGLVYDFARPLQSAASTRQRPNLSHTKPKVERQSVFMEFEGASGNGKAIGFRPAQPQVRYCKGKLAYNSATFDKVAIKDLYEGIDLVVYLDQPSQQPRYDLVVHPGADPEKIRIRYRGADYVRDGGDNELLVGTHLTQIREGAPVAYQPTQTSSARVAAHRRLYADGSRGFQIAGYDHTKNLVIDPIIWSTYQGGNKDDAITAVQAGPDSSTYVAGWTYSTDFPANYGHGINVTGSSAFCSKYSVDGNLQWTTILGGNGLTINKAYGLAVSKYSGVAYITGEAALDFPVSDNAFLTQINSPDRNIDGDVRYAYQGLSDAFVARISAFGNRDWASFLGGHAEEAGYAITMDGVENPYVVGYTSSYGAVSPGYDPHAGFTGSLAYEDFPVTPNAVQFSALGGVNGFYAKFNSTGSGLYYASLLGGYVNTLTIPQAITLDNKGDLYIAGWTNTSLKNAWETLFGPGLSPLMHEDRLVSGKNAFVMKLSYRNGPFNFYTAFGAPFGDAEATAISVDGFEPVVAGWATRQIFTWSNGFQPNTAGGEDGFVYRLDPQLLYPLDATMVGGSGNDRITSMTRCGDGFRFAGTTTSSDFPIVGSAVQKTYQGNGDAFTFKTDHYFQTLGWSSFLGGTGQDVANGVAQLQDGSFTVGGVTGSLDFPVSYLAAQPGFGGGNTDGFLTRIDNSQFILDLSADKTTVTSGDTVTITVTLAKAAGVAQLIHVDSSNPAYIAPFDITVPTGATTATYEATVQGIFAGAVKKGVLSVTFGRRKSVALSIVAPFALTLDQTTVVGGASATGTITIPNARTYDMSISLTTRLTAIVPDSVIVPAGETQATFTITTRKPTQNVVANVKASMGTYTTTVPLTITRN